MLTEHLQEFDVTNAIVHLLTPEFHSTGITSTSRARPSSPGALEHSLQADKRYSEASTFAARLETRHFWLEQMLPWQQQFRNGCQFKNFFPAVRKYCARG